jgi:hypothetical protein
MIVVREANGILRKADDHEREKILQVYYPKEGNALHIPAMFEPANLEVDSILNLKITKRVLSCRSREHMSMDIFICLWTINFFLYKKKKK